MMSIRPRKTAFALAVVAAVGAPVLLTSSKVNAADNDFPACASLSGTAKALCAARELDKRIAAAKKGAAAAREQSAAAIQETEATNRRIDQLRKENDTLVEIKECTFYLMDLVNKKAVTKEAILQKAGGKLTKENTCPIAREHGFKRREALAIPANN